jgi:putative transposase
MDLRRVLNGVAFRLCTGCRWNQLPRQFDYDSTGHRHLHRRWQQGLFVCLCAVLVQECAAVHGVDRQWQAVDTRMGNARLGGDLVGRSPTDRGEKG